MLERSRKGKRRPGGRDGFDHESRARRCGFVVVCARTAAPARFALEVPLKAVIFNDAGVGSDSAGIAALARRSAVAAATVAHSGRIGDSMDMWKTVLSHVNAAGQVEAPARRTGAHVLTQLVSR
jgi:hypothetical protein